MPTRSNKSMIVAAVLLAGPISRNGCDCDCIDFSAPDAGQGDPYECTAGCAPCSDPVPHACYAEAFSFDELPCRSGERTSCSELGLRGDSDVWCDIEACNWGIEYCEPVVCGDGRREHGEACDDGNTEDGDGCNSLCVIERCGDGIVTPDLGETCDGSLGCSDDCTHQARANDGVCDENEAWGIAEDVLLSADCRCRDGEFTAIDQDFLAENAALEPFGCYRAASDLTIRELGVSAGVTVAFEDRVAWTVGGDVPAAFNVFGTENAPVLFAAADRFSGNTPEFGDWDGITFAHTDGTATLEFLEIDAAGGADGAAITVDAHHEGAEVAISLLEVDIRGSAGAGIRIEPDGGFATSPDAFVARALSVADTDGPALDLRAHHVTGLWDIGLLGPAGSDHSLEGDVVLRPSQAGTRAHDVWLAPHLVRTEPVELVYATAESVCGLDESGHIRCTGAGDDGVFAPATRHYGRSAAFDPAYRSVERAWPRGRGAALRCGFLADSGDLRCDLDGTSATTPDELGTVTALRPVGWGLLATTEGGEVVLAPSLDGVTVEAWPVPPEDDPIVDVALQGSGAPNDGLLFTIRESGAIASFAIDRSLTALGPASEHEEESARTRFVPIRGDRPALFHPYGWVYHPIADREVNIFDYEEDRPTLRTSGDLALCVERGVTSESDTLRHVCMRAGGLITGGSRQDGRVLAAGDSVTLFERGEFYWEDPMGPPHLRQPDYILQGVDGVFEFSHDAELHIGPNVRVAVAPGTRVSVEGSASIGDPDEPVTFVGTEDAAWGPLTFGNTDEDRAVHVRLVDTGEDGALVVEGAPGSITATAIIASAATPITGNAEALAECALAVAASATLDDDFAPCTQRAVLCPNTWMWATPCDDLVECPTSEYDEAGCAGDMCATDADCWGVCFDGVCEEPP